MNLSRCAAAAFVVMSVSGCGESPLYLVGTYDNGHSTTLGRVYGRELCIDLANTYNQAIRTHGDAFEVDLSCARRPEGLIVGDDTFSLRLVAVTDAGLSVVDAAGMAHTMYCKKLASVLSRAYRDASFTCETAE